MSSQVEPCCIVENGVTPRHGLPMGFLRCELNISCDPDKPRRYIEEWLAWMDTIYEQVDAEIASMKEFHEAWAHDRRTFRLMVRAACNAKYGELNKTEPGEVWPIISRLHVRRPYLGAGKGFHPIENRIIQDWSNTYGQR